MGMLRGLLLVPLMGVCALAQSPTYGVGRTPSAEEIRAWDISIGPTGEELPPGRGTVREGAQVYRAKGCAGCHGFEGKGNQALGAPNLTDDVWLYGRSDPQGIAETIRRGRNGVMPAWRDRLGDEDASLVAAWVYARSRPATVATR